MIFLWKKSVTLIICREMIIGKVCYIMYCSGLFALVIWERKDGFLIVNSGTIC